MSWCDLFIFVPRLIADEFVARVIRWISYISKKEHNGCDLCTVVCFGWFFLVFDLCCR